MRRLRLWPPGAAAVVLALLADRTRGGPGTAPPSRLEAAGPPARLPGAGEPPPDAASAAPPEGAPPEGEPPPEGGAEPPPDARRASRRRRPTRRWAEPPPEGGGDAGGAPPAGELPQSLGADGGNVRIRWDRSARPLGELPPPGGGVYVVYKDGRPEAVHMAKDFRADVARRFAGEAELEAYGEVAGERGEQWEQGEDESGRRRRGRRARRRCRRYIRYGRTRRMGRSGRVRFLRRCGASR